MGGALRFQQIAPFQKHLQTSLQMSQAPKAYLIVYAQREERRRILENIIENLQKTFEGASASFLDAEEVPWSQVADQLNTRSFFASHVIVVWDGIKQLSDKAQEAVLHYLQHPSDSAFLLLGGESAKVFSKVYKDAKQELVVLDLSEEKPWDKQKRLQQEILMKLASEKKKITPDALSHLFLLCGNDAVALESEINKCLCFIGDRTTIQEQDVLSIGSCSVSANGWQIAEQVIWDAEAEIPFPSIDLSFLLPFIGQMRFQLQQGRLLELYIHKGLSPEQISEALPSIRPAQLQKRLAKVRSRGFGYFEKALAELFEIELLAKNSSLSPRILFDLLLSKLLFLKQPYAK
jgi:DNA polymerase III subunit delta